MATINPVISPEAISFESVKQELLDFIQNKPDFLAWKDFFEASAGTTLVELLAGFCVYIQFAIVANRRETYLQHATHKSAVIAIDQGLGFSAFRGSNVRLKLNITPDATQLFNKLDVIGVHGDVDIVAADNLVLNAGVANDIEVILGSVLEETVTVNTSELVVFRFISSFVSDDIVLFLNSTVIPFSNNIPDLLENTYVTLTNSFGAIDLMYINNAVNATFNYDVGDVFKLRYVKNEEIVVDQTALDLFNGTVNTVETAVSFKPMETVDKLRISGPLHHETQKLVRGRNDFKKLLLVTIPDSVSTNAFDVSPAVVFVSYVLEDLSLLNQVQKDDILEKIDKFRPFGVQQTTVIDPTQIDMDLTVTITLKSADTIAILGLSQIQTDVRGVLAKFEKTLELEFDVKAVENAIEEFDYVQIARAEITNNVSTTLAWSEYFIINENIILL